MAAVPRGGCGARRGRPGGRDGSGWPLRGLLLAALLLALGSLPGGTRGDFVCTQMLKAKFSSLFISQEVPQTALDTARLCGMCEGIARLAFVLVNGAETRASWEQGLRDSGCTFAERHAENDCSELVEAMLKLESNYFLSDKAKLSAAESSDSVVMALALRARATQLCTEVMCCPQANGTLSSGEGSSSDSSGTTQASASVAAPAKRLSRALTGRVLAPLAADASAPASGSDGGSQAPATQGATGHTLNETERSIYANVSSDQTMARLVADRARLDEEKRVFDHKAAYLENGWTKLKAEKEQVNKEKEEVAHEKKLLASGVVKEEMEHNLRERERERAEKRARREKERQEEEAMERKRIMREDEIEAAVKKEEARATDADEGKRKGEEVRARMKLEVNRDLQDMYKKRKEAREEEERKEKEEEDELNKKRNAQVNPQGAGNQTQSGSGTAPSFRERLSLRDDDGTDESLSGP